MKDEIKKIIEVMIPQIREHVPDYGDFAPILEFFDNPDRLTAEFVGQSNLMRNLGYGSILHDNNLAPRIGN